MKRGAQVVAVEVDANAANVAKTRGVDVRVGLVDEVLPRSDYGRFDCLVFADVLEHIVDPLRFLSRSLRFLRPGGQVVISVPNVAHWSVRSQLLAGRFNYTPTGLLDETHVHFFTAASLQKMLAECGLTVMERRYSLGADLYGRLEHRTLRWQRQKLLRGLSRRWPGLFAFQFVWKAQYDGSTHLRSHDGHDQQRVEHSAVLGGDGEHGE
jgi:SAM-dependent methyltransferase